ncbi:hypothetical protein JCM10908_001956 [Rhodotorula pacifica]|uniref:uncharacterized protein n=1 Tax=Rhodotorula pacifica TaxID=1495444 RepID=UPI00316D7162
MAASGSSDPRWAPLGDKRAGTIAVCTAACVSLAFILAFSSWVAYLLYRHNARVKARRTEKKEETRAVRFLASSHGILLGSLIFGDFVQSLGFSLSWAWVARGEIPTAAYPTALCTTQGLLIQLGDLGSAFSSLVICMNLTMILVFRITPATQWLVVALLFEWTVIILLAAIGPLSRLGKEGVPYYGPSGGWCWVNSAYQTERLVLHYLWVFIVAFLELVFFSTIAIYLKWHRGGSLGQRPLTQTGNISKIMLIYPVVYVATILPLSIFRCAGMAGYHWNIHILLVAGAIFTLSGAANCTIYALTRKLISFDGIGSVLRRGSTSASGSRGNDSPSVFRRGSGATIVPNSPTPAQPPRPRAVVRFERSAFSLFFRPGEHYSSSNSNVFDGIIVEVETTKQQEAPVPSPVLPQQHFDEIPPSRRPSKPEVKWDLESLPIEDRPFDRLEPRDSFELGLSRTVSAADGSDKPEV